MNTQPTAHPQRLGLILTACCLGQFLMVLDASAINVALHGISESLHFDERTLQWVITAYTIVFCGFLLLGGRLADLFGQRRVFLAGTATFTVASLVGGLAIGPATMVLARAFQGLGAAIMVPATLTVLGTTFTAPRQRAKALGLWSAVAGGGGAAGAIIGGMLVGMLGWRWVPLANVPIGVVLLVLAARVVPARPGTAGRRKLDVAGAGSVTLGLMALVYGITEGQRVGWTSPVILAALVAAAVLIGFFLVDQVVLAEQPLVPLNIFRNRSVSAANGVAVFASGALGSTFYFCTLLFLVVLGYSPEITGALYLPLSLGIFVAAWSVSPLVPRLGPRPILVTGLALAAAGLAWMSLADQNSSFVADLLGPCLLLGIGEGLVMTATTAAATAAVPADQAGLASGLLNTTRQLGVAVSLAVLVAVSSARIGSVLSGGGSEIEAMASGYGLGFLVAAGMLVAGLVVALVVPTGGGAPKPPVDGSAAATTDGTATAHTDEPARSPALSASQA